MEFISIGAFLIISTFLALRSYKTSRTRSNLQVVWVYATLIIAVLACGLATVTNKDYSWNEKESITLSLNIFGLVLIYAIAKSKNLTFMNPWVRGWLALVFKSVPQAMLAVAIWSAGGASMPLSAIVVGHVNMLTRIWQIVASAQNSGWDEPKKAVLLAEAGSELTWSIMTAVWLVVQWS